MQNFQRGTRREWRSRFKARPRLVCLMAWLLCAALQGCAAISNPVANGVPVRLLPDELLGESKEGLQPIPLAMLGQKQPKAYKVGPDDVLGIWIEGILGERNQAPPLQLTQYSNLPPSLGFPIPVRSDGSIALPLIAPIKVQGMTLEQVQEAIVKAYTVSKQIIQPGRERIIVTLQRPRQYHVLVIRQDAGGGEAGSNVGGAGSTGLRNSSRATGFIIGVGGGGQGSRRGAGFAIDLPAYENDVLNALAQTGGLPGTDAVDEIIIERGALKEGVLDKLKASPGEADVQALSAEGTKQIRIPMRIRPGENYSISPEDVILQSGDIVFIKARESDVFYTGGLLPAGEYVLPRDTDLDILEALTRIGGALNSGGLSTINITGTLVTPGFGAPSPSLVSVVRKTANHGQVVIRVDLNAALRDPRERIRIQPRDLILLQERPDEAMARYFSQTFKFNILQKFVDTSRTTATGSGSVP